MYSLKRQKGNIAEEIVVSRVKREGFNIICQNYLKKWGEIDIVAEKSRKIHFIEVKSVSRETKLDLAKESCFMGDIEGKIWTICDFLCIPRGKPRGYQVEEKIIPSVVEGLPSYPAACRRVVDSGPFSARGGSTSGMTCETDKNSFNPVWNMTNKKKLRFSKVIRTYLADTYREVFPEFQIDLFAVSLDFYKKIAYISKVENILLEEI